LPELVAVPVEIVLFDAEYFREVPFYHLIEPKKYRFK